jgi:hypothetical protein
LIMKHLRRLTMTAVAVAATTGMLSPFAVDAQAAQPSRPLLMMAGTNAANGNAVAVFRLDLTATPELVFSELVPTGGSGGNDGERPHTVDWIRDIHPLGLPSVSRLYRKIPAR